MTYAGFDRSIDAFALALRRMKVGVGDRVAISLANRPELLIAFFACQKLGAVAVLLNYGLMARELQIIAQDCRPSVWLYDEFSVNSLRVSLDRVGLPASALISCGAARISGSCSYRELTGGVSDGGMESPDITPAAPSLIMYTSGTTGNPKGVVLSHAAQWINTILMVAELLYRGSDRALHVAPLYHVAAFHVVALPVLFTGGCNILVKKYDAAAVDALVAETKPTTILGAPTHFEMWSRSKSPRDPVAAGEARGRIRHLMFTGAPIRVDTLAWMKETLSDQIWNVYGQTEACSLITIVPPEQLSRMSAVNCIGRPLLGMDVALAAVDGHDAGEAAGARRRGELISRGPKMMSEYYQLPAKTKEKFVDGWLRTGDLVEVDNDGYYYYLGRVDDLIITGGENVYPSEVEDILMSHPKIEDCVVAGLADDVWGQMIAAYVVPGAASPSLAELTEFSKQNLATHKRPRQWYLVDEIPRSPAGKVLVKALRGASLSALGKDAS